MMQTCARCIYDERVSGITFDESGVCNYCIQTDELRTKFGTGTLAGQQKLNDIIEKIKFEGRNNQYDCLIGVSGGVDSSYMAYFAKSKGLRPLAIHYDNTWNTGIASQNIKNVLSSLSIDLITYVVNHKVVDDIYKAFFLAGVAELDCCTDLGFAFILRKYAAKFSIKYVLEGHSFTEEGITPLGRNYFDGKYIKDIHNKYGTRSLKGYPLMTFSRFLWSCLKSRIKIIRPYWYMHYTKKEAKQFLSNNFRWSDYGGHHLENRMTSFLHSIYLPQKFNTDMRNNTLSSQVRNGALNRDIALREYQAPPTVDKELLKYFLQRLELGEEQYNQKMIDTPSHWTEFKTYKKRFERYRFLFKYLSDKELVPYSFYLKYCFENN